MGYILPVQSNQYTDYQNRVLEEKTNLMFIEPPFKVFLESKYNEANHTRTKEHEFLLTEHKHQLKDKEKNIFIW